MATVQHPQQSLIHFHRGKLTDDFLRHLFEALLRPRMIEEKMLLLLRQGRISKWFSGIGQEAIAVGVTMALADDDFILPLHRNLGVFTARGVPFARLFSQWQGTTGGFTKGRDRSFHFGSKEHHLVGMISHLGPQNGVADGIALAAQLKKTKQVTAVFNGDGGTSEGDFHEAVNLAAVWDLPVLFIIENNGFGLSTPTAEQFRCEHLSDKGTGYGIEAVTIDGNNVLEVYQTISKLVAELRIRSRPVLVELMTFRMRGHEEASGTSYVPSHLFDEWSRLDPVKNFETWLLSERILNEVQRNETRERIRNEIDQGLEEASRETLPIADEKTELADLFEPSVPVVMPVNEKAEEKRFVDAIREGLMQSMERFPQLVLMGQDIARYGGVFKVTEGFVEKFGAERVRNTPLCEAAVIGAALGLSIADMKGLVEMQFADFVTEGFNQIVNNLAKIHWRWGQKADVVIRMPTGAGTGAGPFHSQSNEAWFFHTPGLKIVYPSNPYDAKGLMNAAIADPNPVLYFEHKFLYRSIRGEVPGDYYTVEIGPARILENGSDLTLITYGLGVIWAKEVTSEFTNTSIELIDLRTLLPWDKEAVLKSVQKTGRVLVLHEDTLTGGIGAEIAAWIGENCFAWLDAPVMRIGSLDTPVPFSKLLEDGFLAKSRLKDKIAELLAY